MSVKMELIDELRKRANVSYEDAKEALENSNEDILEALVYLEKQNKIKAEQKPERCGLWNKFKALIKKGNASRFIIKKRDNILLSMPVTLAIIIAILANHLALIALIIALIFGYRIKFEGPKGDNLEINRVMDKVSDTIDNAKKNLAKDASNDSAPSNQ